VGDAEIIPLGTRGRPGRGTGSSTPSSSSRNLAAGPGSRAAAREQHPSVRVPAQKRAEQMAAERKAERQAEQRAENQIAIARKTEEAETLAESDDAAQSATEPAAQPTARPPRSRAPATTDHRHPGPGIPPLEWLAAFTSAAKEIFGENWEPRLAEFLAFLRRRLTGEFSVDEYGFDREVTQQFLVAALRPIARRWFRVEVRGAENIPAQGGALVVSNHSGVVPVDGLMTAVSIHDHTGRFLRPLGADLVFKLPIIGDLARKGGATLACNEDAERMLSGGELVGVWPEGFKGIGKPFSERYKLQRFGRGGFVSAAIRAGVPIIPTSVVGAEEIYPLVGNIPSLARLLGVPYIPITPLFPWLGPLGLIPLPSKWLIEFGEPIRTDEYDGGAADDPMLVFNVTDQVRESIQQTLYTLLMQRKSVFS
jgi:1-acyl-sn-glycerol-3-phosphate acyltransferase